MLVLTQIERIAEVRFALLFILLAGFALRIVAALILPDQSATLGDAIAYREAGQSLGATGQLGTPYHMPLYPALVAVAGPGWTQLLIDIGLSTAMIWLVYELTNLIFLAAAFTAIYPYFIFYSIVGLTEALFMALLVAAYDHCPHGLSWIASLPLAARTVPRHSGRGWHNPSHRTMACE
jgi:hypothetical protein